MRTFVLEIVATLGCASDASPQPKAGPAPAREAAREPQRGAPMTNVVKQLTPQTQGAHLVLAGTRLAWLHGGALELRDLATGKPLGSVQVGAAAVAIAARDGAVVAVINDLAHKQAHVVELAATGAATTDHPVTDASTFAGAERLYATADRLFVATRTALEIYKRAPAVDLVNHVSWKRDEAKTFTGAGDAVYFHDGNAYQRIAADGTKASFASSDSSPVHVAPGPAPDLLWATTDDELRLVKLAGGAATITQRIKLAGIYHLAAAGDAAAVVSIATKAGAYDKVTVSLVGRDGAVRWTAQVAPPKQTTGWIAGSASHVALAFGDELHAWAVKDGAPITP